MEYKVGDKVRVVSERTFGMNNSGKADCWLGKIMTIKEICCDELYYMKEDYAEWLWSNEEIVSKVEENIHYKISETELLELLKVNLKYDYVMKIMTGDSDNVVTLAEDGYSSYEDCARELLKSFKQV